MSNPLTDLRESLEASYRVERELGAGGMATVYLAHDLKHDRPVAIKVLRPELAAILGGERFLKEIRLTANLQHPHILPLHDSGQADNLVYYVMPYVEGESLRMRLAREKQLPVDEAVRVAREVADALDYAHRHGIVHRDIKPENILLHDGRALVADFGIALAVSTTGSTRMTETGMSLGTPQYMSPEQAMGEREITPRADVYALGCVLYEMLLGEPPFTGPTAQAVFAKVMTDEPRAITINRRTVPPHVEQAVMRSLSKLPADRFATAAQFAEALNRAAPAAAAPRDQAPRPPVRARLRRAAPAAAAALLLVAAGFATARLLHRPPQAHVGRFTILTGEDQRITGAPLGLLALSPDGQTLVYAGENSRGLQLYLRRMGELTALPIPGTVGALNPLISPDGQWLAYYTGTAVSKVALAGGAPVTIPLAAEARNAQSMTWLDNNTFLLTMGDGSLAKVTPNGPIDRFARPDSATGSALLPMQPLPGNRWLLAVAANGGTLTGGAVAIDVASGEKRQVVEGSVAAVGYADGALAWLLADGTLFGATFDVRALRVTGPTVTLAQNVRVAVGGVAGIAFSISGALAYVPMLPFELVLVDRTGRTTALTETQARFHSPRFSPDGRRIAVDFTMAGGRDVWMLDRVQRTFTRVTFENDGHDPVWLPGGRRIAYASSRGGVVGTFLRNADGGGVAESLLVNPLAQMTAATFTPDGATLIAHTNGPDGSWDIVTVPLQGTPRAAQPLLVSQFNEQYPALSPDGRWLAYVSDESGRPEVYVRGYPDGAGRVLVSQAGGMEPRWSPAGRELFYRSFGDRGAPFVAAVLRTAPELEVVSRTTLFNSDPYEAAGPHANYDVSPDGRSFVMVKQGRLSEMVLIQNWPEEVRRRSAR